jgi:hypothetical protein
MGSVIKTICEDRENDEKIKFEHELGELRSVVRNSCLTVPV